MISQIINDLFEVPITLVSRRGWGKSSSVKTIVKKLLEGNPETIIKVFDPSLAWFHNAPVVNRQYVDLDAITQGRIDNIGSCVYGLNLTSEDTRAFIASVIRSDYEERLVISLKYGDLVVKTLPAIIYVFEESNIIFSTNSLRKADASAEVFSKYLSIGRNLGLGGIFITTRGRELSTMARDRSKILWGRVLGESDLRLVKSVSSKDVRDATKTLRKYHWLYDQSPLAFRILDECITKPTDYKARGSKPQPKNEEHLDLNGNPIPAWKRGIAYLILGTCTIASVLFIIACMKFSILLL